MQVERHFALLLNNLSKAIIASHSATKFKPAKTSLFLQEMLRYCYRLLLSESSCANHALVISSVPPMIFDIV